jgi:hypothetical protein
LAELISEGITKFDHLPRPTDWALTIGLLTVELRRATKVRISVACIHRTTQTLEECGKGCATTKAVIDASAL